MIDPPTFATVRLSCYWPFTDCVAVRWRACAWKISIGPVGDAIVRYLREVRPRCACREIFLALKAPFRPLSPGAVTPIVRSRLVTLGVQLPRRGAHSLRHACAQHLLSCGFSLKQIGDQLGHRHASTTLYYTKIDLEGLRQVAELDLRKLL